METNYEHYKDDMLKAIISHKLCDFIQEKVYNDYSDECLNGCGKCDEIFEEWLDKPYIEPKVEINWFNVPVDTPVLVWETEDIKHRRYFKNITGNGERYICFVDGKTSWTTNETLSWSGCELANEEDIEKYKKV